MGTLLPSFKAASASGWSLARLHLVPSEEWVKLYLHLPVCLMGSMWTSLLLLWPLLKAITWTCVCDTCFCLETVMKHCKHKNIYQVVATSEKDIFIFIRTSRSALWPTQPPIQHVPGFVPGDKAAGAWSNHSPSRYCVKNEWSCTSTPIYLFLHGVDRNNYLFVTKIILKRVWWDYMTLYTKAQHTNFHTINSPITLLITFALFVISLKSVITLIRRCLVSNVYELSSALL
jgi:hypothetical protein